MARMNDSEETFFERNRTKIVTGGLATLVVVISLYAVVQSNQAGDTAGEAKGKIQVIEQNASNCLPKPGKTKPRRPRLCKAGFDQAVQLITPLQACQLLQRGEGLIVIGDERVQEIRCILPSGKSVPENNANGGNPGANTNPKGSNQTGIPPRDPSEGSDQPSEGNGGGGVEKGGSGPGNSSPDDPGTGVGNPPGSNGGGDDANPVVNPPGTTDPGTNPSPDETPGSQDDTIVGAVVGAVEGTVAGALEEVCKTNVLGLRVCVKVER